MSKNVFGGKRQAFLKSSTTAVLIVASLLGANKAFAQTAAEAEAGDVVVTGSRIVRNGFQAPTPVSVVGRDELENSAKSDIADYVNTMPALQNSTSPQSGLQGISAASAGVNGLNLRSLGLSRTLVLLDGQRVIPSLPSAVVDVSEFPQQLISRVDIVTGGASAAYGSDAVAGVVNFILDKTFTGVKVDVSGKTTGYGDDKGWDVQASAGTPWGGGRGHFLISAATSASDGIMVNTRPWNLTGLAMIPNPNYTPTNGQPSLIKASQVAINTATPGGLIFSGPLKGTYFGLGGTPYQFQPGTININGWQSGGSWLASQIRGTYPSGGQSLDPIQWKANAFSRVSYDVTDNLNVFAQVDYSKTHNESLIGPATYQGNLTIRADNAFLPAEIRARLASLGQTSFLFGTSGDNTSRGADYTRSTRRISIGADGSLDLMGREWRWDANIQDGKAVGISIASNSLHIPRYMDGMDSVFDANGRIVCRSTLTNPNNGCVPYNVIGTGVVSDAARANVYGRPGQYLELLQTSFAANMSGEVFDLPAGPLSAAFGFEARKHKSSGYNDASRDPSGTNPWHITPTTVPNGSQKTVEGYLELDAPILRDVPLASSLDVNAAARVTNYDSFGTITTWKIGTTYNPISDLRIRVTRSYDFRAPTLLDLYADASGSNAGAIRSVQDPACGYCTVNYRGVTPGNPNLEPEKANTWGVGFVYQPSFIPGFAVSYDFFDIKIDDVIGGVVTPPGIDSNRYILDQCFNGNATFCQNVERPVGQPIIIKSSPLNLASENLQGFDVEASYSLPLDSIFDSWNGQFQIRALASHYIKDDVDSGTPGVPITDGVGNPDVLPEWSFNVAARYEVGNANFGVTLRGHNEGVYNPAFIECQAPNCPASTTANPTTEINTREATGYWDINGAYKIPLSDGAGTVQIYGNVANLFERDPPPYYKQLTGTGQQENLATWRGYDLLGRVFRVGVRVSY